MNPFGFIVKSKILDIDFPVFKKNILKKHFLENKPLWIWENGNYMEENGTKE